MRINFNIFQLQVSFFIANYPSGFKKVDTVLKVIAVVKPLFETLITLQWNLPSSGYDWDSVHIWKMTKGYLQKKKEKYVENYSHKLLPDSPLHYPLHSLFSFWFLLAFQYCLGRRGFDVLHVSVSSLWDPCSLFSSLVRLSPLSLSLPLSTFSPAFQNHLTTSHLVGKMTLRQQMSWPLDFTNSTKH